MANINEITCQHLRDLVPYQSARRIGGHGHSFLNANESPKSELYMFNSTTLNRYPDCQPFDILHLYADYVGNGLRPDNVLVSRGSDEAIGLIIRAFCEVNEGIIIAPPTYGMYEIAARTNRANVYYAKRDDNFILHKESIENAIKEAPFKVKVVFIDSPCNPLGSIFSRDDVEYLLKNNEDVLFVIDEAYIEFCKENSVTNLLTKYNNLIVLRTLSKAFALAGIRCGFTLACKEIIQVLLKVIDPYPIPDPVSQIARQALARGGISMMEDRVALAIKRRNILKEALLNLSFVKKIFDDTANYLLVEFEDGPFVFESLKQKGIILRSFAKVEGLSNTIRITIGNDEELDELMRSLTALDK